jgi:hypothetical protein
MVLDLHQLNGLFLVLVQLVEILCLHLFEGIHLSRSQVDCLVDLGVLLTRAQYLETFEVASAEHFV